MVGTLSLTEGDEGREGEEGERKGGRKIIEYSKYHMIMGMLDTFFLRAPTL